MAIRKCKKPGCRYQKTIPPYNSTAVHLCVCPKCAGYGKKKEPQKKVYEMKRTK